ncbi:MAG: VWA domain-containing protein [Candidatus Latescibacteria bacterium]|nr:VWA domain-containing protein [Candidatus Latescibacterota bacterium]
MRFGDPFAFWFLIFVPALALVYWWGFRRKKRALAAFGNPSLVTKLANLASSGRQWAKSGLIVGGFLFLILALVQPQFGTKVELIHRRGVDLVIALDTSLSMLAEDIRPNRLTRARYEIADLIDRLEGDRVGLIAFAGRSHVLCPLTLDYGAAKLFLNSATTDLIPVQGTALADAMRNGLRAFGSSEGKYQAFLLITDGENHVDDPVAVAQEAAEAGVRIFVVGVGTPDGELIPVRDGDRVDYLKDQSGNIVKTRLDEPTLRAIAEETGGLYVRAGGGGIGLQVVYEQISQMEKRDLGARKYSQYKHRFQWPLGLALICFLSEALLSDRRRQKEEWQGRFEQ